MGSSSCTANQPIEQTESTKKVTFDPKDLKPEVLESTNHKMSKKRIPNRTVSIIKAEDLGERLKRNPNMEEVLPTFVDVKQFIVNVIDQQEDIEDFDQLHKLFNREIIQPFEKLSNDEQRLLMGDHMAKIGIVKPLVDLYQKILVEHELCDGISPSLEDEDEAEEYYHVIKDIKTILWNFSDASKDFGLAISEETDLFQFLVKDLQATFKEGVPNLTDKEFCFNSAVAIITNCGRAGVNKSSFNVEVSSNQGGNDTTTVNIHMVDVLIPFLQSKIQFVKITTLIALSYMVNEDQNKFLTADPFLFDFLLDMITEAVKAKDKRHEGFSVHELIDGLAGLAKSDDNKVKIMERKKTYKMLKDSVKSKFEEQQLAAVRAIWELAFAEKNKKKFTGDKELMSHLERLQKHNNSELVESAGKALFVINPENEKNLMKSVEGKESIPEDPEHRQHVMISYQWSNQKTILQIRDKLREHNFPVWIDVEFMEGSMLQMMASAIEKAAVVLVCYSEKYKDSKNCRTEAEYAFTRDKMVVPVLLQNGYRPDGWLGILIGSKKFYDFSGKYDFGKKFREMKTELNGLMNPAACKQSTLPQATTYVPQPQINKEEIVLLQWKRQDMQNWLQQNDLQAFSGLQELSGEQLCFLYKLFIRAPDFFYKCLETKLGLKSLEELMKFDQALEKLAKDHPEINKLVN